jgi:hypothetical protein
MRKKMNKEDNFNEGLNEKEIQEMREYFDKEVWSEIKNSDLIKIF